MHLWYPENQLKEGISMDKTEGGSCRCVCHKFNGILIFLIGLTFLLGAFDVLSAKVVSITWPIFVMLGGLKNSIGKGRCKCCDKA
jgi:hypothetical protein